jgi:hypothetical protein
LHSFKAPRPSSSTRGLQNATAKFFTFIKRASGVHHSTALRDAGTSIALLDLSSNLNEQVTLCRENSSFLVAIFMLAKTTLDRTAGGA